MEWLFYILIAACLFSIAVTVDKFLLDNDVDVDAYPMYIVSVSTLAGVIVFSLSGFPFIKHVQSAIIVVTSGMLTIFSMIFYLKALNESKATNVNVYFQLIPIIIFVITVLPPFNEIFSLTQVIGALLVLGGSTLVYLTDEEKKFGIDEWKLAFNIIFFDLLTSLAYILVRYGSKEVSFTSLFSYESLGIFIGGTLIYVFSKRIRKAFQKNIQMISKRSVKLVSINETLFVIAKACAFKAFMLKEAALVATVETTQVLFGLIAVYIGGKISKDIYEKNTKKSVCIKFFAFILTAVGIYLVS